LIKLTNPEDSAPADFWPVVLAIFAQKANKKSFFMGRRVGPTLADTELILTKIGGPESFNAENWR